MPTVSTNNDLKYMIKHQSTGQKHQMLQFQFVPMWKSNEKAKAFYHKAWQRRQFDARETVGRYYGRCRCRQHRIVRRLKPVSALLRILRSRIIDDNRCWCPKLYCQCNLVRHVLGNVIRFVLNTDRLTLSCLSLIHIWRCRRSTLCRSRWSPYH